MESVRVVRVFRGSPPPACGHLLNAVGAAGPSDWSDPVPQMAV